MEHVNKMFTCCPLFCFKEFGDGQIFSLFGHEHCDNTHFTHLIGSFLFSLYYIPTTCISGHTTNGFRDLSIVCQKRFTKFRECLMTMRFKNQFIHRQKRCNTGYCSIGNWMIDEMCMYEYYHGLFNHCSVLYQAWSGS